MAPQQHIIPETIEGWRPPSVTPTQVGKVFDTARTQLASMVYRRNKPNYLRVRLTLTLSYGTGPKDHSTRGWEFWKLARPAASSRAAAAAVAAAC